MNTNRFSHILLICCVTIAFGCQEKPKNSFAQNAHEESMRTFLVAMEKEKNRAEQFDSLFYGIHFKMTLPQFHGHCNAMYKKGLFDGNNNYEVIINLKKGFEKPVDLIFSPTFDEPFIKLLKVRFSYTNSSVFDQKTGSDVLIEELLEEMMEWYGGSDFLEISPKYPYEKPYYIKLDGNRKITLKEGDSYREVIALYEDLKPLY